MIPSLRTVTLLMLAAGLSLGVFASRAFSVFGQTTVRPVATRNAVEDRVQYYRERFRLNDSQAARIRQALIAYERAVESKILEIRQNPLYAKDFKDMRDVVEGEVQAVLSTAGR